MGNPFSLEGKFILVTGASSGIGRSIAIECSKMGAKLIITGRNKNRLAETFSMLEGMNNIQYSADLTKEEEIKSLVDFIPKIDGFVSNAGIIKPQILQMSKVEDIYQIIEINTMAPILLTRLLVQNKKINKGGSLVYISSINGNNCSSYGSSIYGASKSALSGFIKGIALELSVRNITVNCINPGMIETSLFENTGIGYEELELDRLKYPLKRYGKPEEIAYATIYLLSEAAGWITGSNLLIDGGFTLK